jgi:hypothetical protein
MQTEDYDQESLPGRSDTKTLRVTVDLGSLRSGYTSILFCFRKEWGSGNVNDIRICSLDGLRKSSKSCLLFDATEDFRYFGEEAMTEYKEVQTYGEANNWFFFDEYDKCLRDKTVSRFSFQLTRVQRCVRLAVMITLRLPPVRLTFWPTLSS